MRTITVLANIAWFALTVLFTVFFLAMGIFLVIFPIMNFSIDTVLNENKFLSMVVGIFMIVIFFKYLIVMWLRTRQEECIAFDNPDGEVIIAVHAVEESVRNLVESFSEIRGVTPHVIAINDGVDVELKVTLWDDTNVHSISEKVQSATKSHIQSFFGLANVNTIKVFITGTARRVTNAQAKMDFDDSQTSEEDAESGSSIK